VRAFLTVTGLLLTTLAAPAGARADAVVVADPAAVGVTALGRTIVWVRSSAGGRETLMRRDANGNVARVKGAPGVFSYGRVDLGRDARGRLVLTYLRCATPDSSCTALRDDLRGHRSSLSDLAVKGCEFTSAPVLWGARVAYGLQCAGDVAVTRRSGLYVKRGTAPAKRLRVPATLPARVRNPLFVGSVDLRAERVAAVVDGDALTFSQDADATRLRSFRASLGSGPRPARGLALGRDGTHWALSTDDDAYAAGLGLPASTVIYKQTATCLQRETITLPAGRLAATDIAVDDTTLHLIVPGVGIVTHDFKPDATPPC